MHYNPTIHIAYADDHDIVRKGIAELINTSSRCRVAIEASNGKDLIRQMEKSEQQIDICVLDIFMPEMNGYETLIAIHKRWPEMRALVLTGHNTEFYLIKMILAGANGYLLKNCSPKELEGALEMIYKNGTFYADMATAKYARQIREGKVKVPSFNDQEMSFLRFCCSDLSYMQIAEQLTVTPKSLDWTRESLFKKLGVNSRSGLIMSAIEHGIVAVQTEATQHFGMH